MKHILYFLGFLWVSPVNILFSIFWCFPMYFKGVFKHVVWDWETWSFQVIVNPSSDFHKSAMKGWAGFVVGSFIVLRKGWVNGIVLRHEQTHVLQNYIFGILFYPLYILCSLFIYLFGNSRTHAYYDNLFEVWARKSAGQPSRLPQDKWRDGQSDRWPWW